MSCRICELEFSKSGMLTKNHVSRHVIKHFDEKPELKEKYFIENENDEPNRDENKMLAIITPLERFIGHTVHNKLMKDI